MYKQVQNFSTLVLLINFFLKKATEWEGDTFFILFFPLILLLYLFFF